MKQLLRDGNIHEFISPGSLSGTKSTIPGGFEETKWFLSSDIKVQEEKIGKLSVSYKRERLKSVFEKETQFQKEQKSEWWIVLEMLKRTDPKLLVRISRKMVNYLGWSGTKEAEALFEHFSPIYKVKEPLLKNIKTPKTWYLTSDSILSQEVASKKNCLWLFSFNALK